MRYQCASSIPLSMGVECSIQTYFIRLTAIYLKNVWCRMLLLQVRMIRKWKCSIHKIEKKRWNKHLSQFLVRYNSKRFFGLLLLYFKVSLRDVYKHTDTWIFLESNNSESQFQPLDNDERRCVVGSGNESHIKNKYAKQRNVSFIKIT